MNIKNIYKKKINILFLIIIIYIIHFSITNPIIKTLSQSYFNYNDIRRPNDICKEDINEPYLNCIGMPSGHSESISVLSFLLYFYKIIPFWLCLLIILIQTSQRVITHMHTVNQVIVGTIIGFFYANIYKYFNLSIFSFLVAFIIELILIVLSIYNLKYKIYEQMPEWIDKNILSTIQDVPLYKKIYDLYVNSIYHYKSRTYIKWSELETYLNIIVDKIKNSNINYDSIVGINNGGNIISTYISLKLNIPKYNIKLDKNSLYEDIENNLIGQNVILIDDYIYSEKNIEKTVAYLKDIKKVNYIYITCIVSDINFNKFKIEHPLKGFITIWPWGFNNYL